MRSRNPLNFAGRLLARRPYSSAVVTALACLLGSIACGSSSARSNGQRNSGGTSGGYFEVSAQAGSTFVSGGRGSLAGNTAGTPARDAAGAAIRSIPTPWIHASGTNFADDQEQIVRFVGVGLSNDAWGIYVWPESDILAKQGKDQLIRPTELYPWCLKDVDFAILDGLPINVVRYSFAYETFAADNPKLEANLVALEANVARLGAMGIYVILNDNMPIGLDGVTDGYVRELPPAQREQSIFESDEYFSRDLAMWQTLARRLASHPEVLAYELINEPRVPSLSEGGKERFQSRLQSLVGAIRDVDPRHVILVPEWNSRESDNANQTVSWEQGMVKIDDNNVGYVLHFYTPWEFTAQGASTYDSSGIVADLKRRIDWRDTVGHAPLFATEYGVNRYQPMAKRLEWLQLVNELFLQNGISSTWFNYKANASAYVNVKSVFALAQQYVKMDDELVKTAVGWEWKSSQAQAAAESNGFVDWYLSYFVSLSPLDVSMTDSEPIVAELRRYQAAK